MSTEREIKENENAAQGGGKIEKLIAREPFAKNESPRFIFQNQPIKVL